MTAEEITKLEESGELERVSPSEDKTILIRESYTYSREEEPIGDMVRLEKSRLQGAADGLATQRAAYDDLTAKLASVGVTIEEQA